MERHIASLDALHEEARRFAQTLSPRADRATLITLSGDLGAGKTSFVQGLAAALGVTEAVTSPTFVLERVYPVSPEQGRGFTQLAHLDAYRLEGAPLAPLGFADRYRDAGTLIALEWPELVASELPEPDHCIKLRVDGPGRSITYA